MDYRQDQKKDEGWWGQKEPPQTSQPVLTDEDKWWEREPDPEDSKENLIDHIITLQRMKVKPPTWMWVIQGFCLLYVLVNAVFLYVSLTSPVRIYIAAYMVPLTMLLLITIFVIGELKKQVTGDKT